MDLGIAGKRALVLGGNRGIGFGIAQALVREGVHVAIAARDAKRLNEAAAQLAIQPGAAVETAELDLAASMNCRLSSRPDRRFGPIDILVTTPADRAMAAPPIVRRGNGATASRTWS